MSDEAAKRAEEVLKANKPVLDRLAEELLKHETLEETELDNASYYGRIFAKCGGLSEAVAAALKELGNEGCAEYADGLRLISLHLAVNGQVFLREGTGKLAVYYSLLSADGDHFEIREIGELLIEGGNDRADRKKGEQEAEKGILYGCGRNYNYGVGNDSDGGDGHEKLGHGATKKHFMYSGDNLG